MGARLTRGAILGAHDIETEEVHVPEWTDPETGADTVLVKALTGKESDSYQASCFQERPVLDAKGRPVKGRTEMVRSLANVRAKLVVRCIVDDEGNRIFSDQDANALGEKSTAALDRVFEVAARLSRLSDEDIEELAGNSEAGQTGDSSSSSPENSAAQ